MYICIGKYESINSQTYIYTYMQVYKFTCWHIYIYTYTKNTCIFYISCLHILKDTDNIRTYTYIVKNTHKYTGS